MHGDGAAAERLRRDQLELSKALRLGVAPQRISFTGPAKLAAHLEAAVEARIGEVVLESVREAEAIAQNYLIFLDIFRRASETHGLTPQKLIWPLVHSMRRGSQAAVCASARTPSHRRVGYSLV